MKKKLVLVLGALVFLIFTYLQLNDATQYGNHDAWTWIFLYLVSSILSIALAFRTLPKHWVVGWAGFAWGCLFFRLQDDQGNFYLSRLHPANYWDPTGTTMIQNSNESGGLLILAIWACVLVLLRRKHT